MPSRKGIMSHLLNAVYNLGLLTALYFAVRSLLKVITPISNALLKANRFLLAQRGEAV